MKKLLLMMGIGFSISTFAQEETTPPAYADHGAPIPVEVMVGNQWAMYQNIITKDFANDKVNFFNLINYEIDHDSEVPPSYIVQSIFSYKLNRLISVGGGANLKAFGGFKPLVAARLEYFDQHVGLVVQPSVEVHQEGVSEVFVLLEWNPMNEGFVSPFFGIQGATNFTTQGGDHDFSYLNARVGVQMGAFRFGPALNSRFIGPTAKAEMNYGGFVTLSIF